MNHTRSASSTLLLLHDAITEADLELCLQQVAESVISQGHADMISMAVSFPALSPLSFVQSEDDVSF
jgi:hypothetical protein